MTDSALVTLPLDRVSVSQTGPQASRRRRFRDEDLDELAGSISRHGVLQPVICRPTATDYELVAGERRYLAAMRAGLSELPAVVRPLPDYAVLDGRQPQEEDTRPARHEDRIGRVSG